MKAQYKVTLRVSLSDGRDDEPVSFLVDYNPGLPPRGYDPGDMAEIKILEAKDSTSNDVLGTIRSPHVVLDRLFDECYDKEYSSRHDHYEES